MSQLPRLSLLCSLFFTLPPLSGQTTISLSTSSNPSFLGSPLSLIASVTPSNATGRVTFYDGVNVLGSRTLAAGAASFVTGLLPSGSRKLKAYYSGDAANAAAASNVVIQAVNAQPASGLFVQGATFGGLTSTQFLVADFNGDGKADLASGGPFAPLAIYLGNGDGTFRTTLSETISTFTLLAAADFTGDGKPDLLLTQYGNSLLIRPGNGDGTLQAAISVPVSSGSVAVGDFNGDGKPDIAIMGFGFVQILLGHGDGTFQAPVSYTSGISTFSTDCITLGDFNGDGKTDIAVGASTYSNLGILLGNGDGTFQSSQLISTSAPVARLVSTDFNGDGKADLLLGLRNDTFAVMLGRGDGSFQNPQTYSVPDWYYLDVGDFNGDGKLDVGVSSYIAVLRLFPGNGDGTFQSPSNTNAIGTAIFAAGEFNGDGKTDIATSTFLLQSTNLILTPTGGTLQATPTGTPFPQQLQVTLRDGGNPVSGASITFSFPGAGPSATLPSVTVITDLSGVARLNISANSVTGSYTATAMYRGLLASFSLTNTSGPPAALTIVSGSPQTAVIGTAFARPLQVKLADSAGNPYSGTAISFTAPSTGATTMLSSATAVTDASGMASIAATAGTVVGGYTVNATYGNLTARFSLANKLEAGVTLSASSGSSVYGAAVTLRATVTPPAATGRITFYDGVTILGTRPLSAGVASMSTILLPTGTRKLWALYSGDATYNVNSAAITQTVNAAPAVGFRAGAPVKIGSVSPVRVSTGDFNGDGKADIVILATSVTTTGTGTVTILSGNGDGTFQPAVTYEVAANPSSMAVADFNADGKPDIAVSGSDTQANGVISILLGNGDGTFQLSYNFAAARGPVSAADFNLDGKADLIVWNDTPVILTGNGDGTFQAPLQPPGISTFTHVLDLNADGKPDLFGGLYNLVTALGNGDNTFQPQSILSGPGALNHPYVATGDFNGDGKLDVTLPTVSGLSVLLGNGDGSFQSAGSYNFNGNVVGADFNGDGILDLAVMNGTSINVLRGNGDGTFRLVLSYTTPDPSIDIAAGDFNGDGKVDLVSIINTSSFPSQGAVTIVSGVAAGVSLTVVGGTQQSALVGTPFTSLQAMVVQDGTPLNGVVVTFSAPASGATAVLPATTAVTNTAGVASLPAVANQFSGSYVVTASYQGLTASFSLTNTTVGSIQVLAGSGQSTLVGTNFPTPLRVLVTDSAGSPAGGAAVTFTAPTTGAAAAVSSGMTDSSGKLSASAYANSVAGSYTVTATAGGRSVVFSLTNTSITSITPSGTPQSTSVGAAFLSPLQLTIKDSAGNPVRDLAVLFTAPGSGASATLTASSAITDVSGVVRVTATANGTAGTYTVTAGFFTNGGFQSVPFTLTNLPAGSANNIALGKTATQSSTLAGYGLGGASAAVDGSTNGNFFAGSVTHTNSEANAWWQVDLGNGATVNSIIVWNRTDCCGDRLADYWVFVSNTPFGAAETPATLQSRTGTFAIHQTAAPNQFSTISVGSYSGRYVRVQLSGTNPLSLAEVQVLGTGGGAPDTNLALGKSATQSSKLAGYGMGSASAAVDGNTDGNFFSGSVTHTNSEANAWWQVDLGTLSTINSIVIWNRTDCCSARLGDYYVFISKIPFGPNDTPGSLLGRAGTYNIYQSGATSSTTTTFNIPAYQGQYVRVQFVGTNPLSLAEVQVFGVPGTSAAVNVALGKPATQSSTLAGYAWAVASSAVDGNTDGAFFDGSVTHTNLDINAWWQVDLGASTNIDAVVIWNRTDACCTGRLGNFWVFISDLPFSPDDTPATLQNRSGVFSAQQFFSSTVAIPGAHGRYVRIQLAGTNNLSLAEVQVYGTALPATNLAVGKAATQSSTLAGYASAAASSAVDGNTDGNFFHGSVTHTNSEPNAWWQVDLGSSANIASMVISNRTDCCSDRLGDYWVFISNTPFNFNDTPAILQNRAGTWSIHQSSAPNPAATIMAGTQGRYVRIQLSGTNPLSLAEVQIIGQ